LENSNDLEVWRVTKYNFFLLHMLESRFLMLNVSIGNFIKWVKFQLKKVYRKIYIFKYRLQLVRPLAIALNSI